VNKFLSILLLVLISSAAIAQEKPEKQYKLKPQPLGLPNAYVQPSKINNERITELVSSNTVRSLSPDKMPCVVPNMSNIVPIPNAFSPGQGIPYMPNSMPLLKKSPGR